MKIILIFFLFLLTISIASASSMNFLTKGFADTLYCKVNGNCTLETINAGNGIFENLTVFGGYFNTTVTNYDVTGNMDVNGNLTVHGEITNITSLIISGNITGDLIPALYGVDNLGSAAKVWAYIYGDGIYGYAVDTHLFAAESYFSDSFAGQWGTAADDDMTFKDDITVYGNADFNDNNGIILGTGHDSKLYYNATHLIIDAQQVGTSDMVLSARYIGIETGTPDSKIHMLGTSAATSSFKIERQSADFYGGYQWFQKGRAGGAAANDNDLTGGLIYSMYNSVPEQFDGAAIVGIVEDNTATTEGIGIKLWTTDDGTDWSFSNTPTMYLTGVGNVGIGGTPAVDKKFHVYGTNPGAPAIQFQNVNGHKWHMGGWTTADKFSITETDVEDWLNMDAVADVITMYKDTNIAGQLIITDGSYPVIRGKRTTTATNNVGSVGDFLRTTSNNMVDGFGVEFSFAIEDSSDIISSIASVSAERSGADNTGLLGFNVWKSGVKQSNLMTIDYNGSVTVTGNINISGNIKVDGCIQYNCTGGCITLGTCI